MLRTPFSRTSARAMATFSIDTTTYRKDQVLPVGQGYGVRAGGIKPTAIVIHSTNGNSGSTFEAEARFLQNSRDVSAHFLVGKTGQTAQILPPDLMAWHTGQSLAPFFNLHSIGIELHHAVGDTWPDIQLQALTWLTRQIMARFAIPATMIETHRYVALPPGRKQDPSDWSDQSFYAWRGALTSAARTYRARVCAPILQDRRPDAPLAGSATIGTMEQVDDVTAGWIHLSSGLGFSPIACWELLL
jgi:N-acetyl-anhydromuramyl-L-alanine amidase AmpD